MKLKPLYLAALEAALAAVLVVSAPAEGLPEYGYDLLHVDWRVTLRPETREVVGQVTHRLRVMPGRTTIGLDAGAMDLLRITVAGRRADWARLGERITVTLPEGTDAKEPIEVGITYRARPTAGLYFVDPQDAFPATTAVAYTQGEMVDTRYWLPILDHPGDKATSAGTITVPKDWSVLSNGTKLSDRVQGEQRTVRWRQDVPHATYLISIVAGPYTETFDGRRPLPVSYWVPKGLERMGEASFADTDRQIQVYERLTGTRYPYAKFAQAAVPDFMFGGMENISAVTQTIGTLHPPEWKPFANSEGLVAHELAHQWFGDYVTTPDWVHVWINEGFATFLPFFIVRDFHGEEAFGRARVGLMEGMSQMSRGAGRAMIRREFSEPIDQFDGFAYSGGAARLMVLHRKLGEKAFWAGIRAYLAEWGGKSPTTEDFFASMSRSTGVDLDRFRQQWFYEKTVPRYELTKTDGGFRLKQADTTFDQQLDVALVAPDGKARMTTVDPSAGEVTIPAPEGTLVVLDPNAWALGIMRYEGNWTPEEAARVYRALPDSVSRTRVLDRVLTSLRTSPELARSLAQIDPETSLRTAFIGRESDLGALAKSAGSENPEVRMAVLRRLERTPSSAERDALIARLGKDPHPAIRREAWILAIRLAGTLEGAEELWRTPAWDEAPRETAFDLWVLHNPAIARKRALEQLAQPINQALRVRAIRALGQVKEANPGESTVRVALEKELSGRTIGGIQTAIGALQTLGDPAAIPALEKLKAHSLHFIRRAASSAVEALKRK